MAISYVVNKPTVDDADGMIRRHIEVTDTNNPNHSPSSKEFTGDPAVLTDQAAISAWERESAGVVYNIQQSRKTSDEERAADRVKWADPIEEDTGGLP